MGRRPREKERGVMERERVFKIEEESGFSLIIGEKKIFNPIMLTI